MTTSGGHRSILRPVCASDFCRYVGGKGDELAGLHPVCLAGAGRAPQMGIWTCGGRRPGDCPADPAERRRLRRRDRPGGLQGLRDLLSSRPSCHGRTGVHEFQNLKHCGLLDVVPGVHACLEIARCWNAERQVETGSDGVLRAQAMFERWRSAIERATDTALRIGRLTPTGVRFVSAARDRRQSLESELAHADAREMAREDALDGMLTWQFMHMAFDAAGMASPAISLQRGEPHRSRTVPRFWIGNYSRKIGLTAHRSMPHMRCLEPKRFAHLRAISLPGLSAAGFLHDGRASAAVKAYHDVIAAEPPLPDRWIGLARAICRLPSMPLLRVFATKLAFMFEMHDRLIGRGSGVIQWI